MPAVNIKARLYEEIIKRGHEVPEFVNEAVAGVLHDELLKEHPEMLKEQEEKA